MASASNPSASQVSVSLSGDPLGRSEVFTHLNCPQRGELQLQPYLGLLPPSLCAGIPKAVFHQRGSRQRRAVRESSRPVEEAESWVYPGQKPSKPECVMKR